MSNRLISKLESVMKVITSNCPQIATFVTDNLRPFDLVFGVGIGFCSEPGLIDVQWMSSIGYRQFALADQPEGFVYFGLQSRDGEYLYIMWFEEGKKFWFYDLIDDSPSSRERIVNRLNLALERWETFHSDVLYSGISDKFFIIGFSPG